MNFKNKPGKEIKTIGTLQKKSEPQITIITPFYNGGSTLMETANAIFSQTYPYYEWILIDDGSKDKMSLNKLKELEKMDSRVKVLHKENGGPSQARDYGIARAAKSSKYIYFLDCDDLIENNMIETLYWTLETHKNGSFAYTSMVNFGAHEYYWEPYLTLEEEKVRNLMCISTMIRKDDLLSVGCFGIKEKAMYEDWNLWLKLIANGKSPVRTNAPLFWYRTSNTGELSRSKNNDKKAMKLINKTAKTIKKEIEVIQFPRRSVEPNNQTNIDDIVLPDYKKNHKIMFILNDAILGKNNIKILELIKSLNKKNYNSIVITTNPEVNNIRQDLKDNCSEFYDLSNFLDVKDYYQFINYIIKSRKVETLILNDTDYGYAMLPNLKKENTINTINLLFDDNNNLNEDLVTCFDSIITTEKNIKTKFNKLKKIEYIGNLNNKNETKYKKDKTKLIEKYKISKNKTIISYINNVSFECRPDVFIDTARQLIENNKKVTFIINGSGKMSVEIKNTIDKLKLSKNILLFDENEMSQEDAYILSDIVVDCSLVEGITLTSYKAIQHNVPVVSINLGKQSEYITDKIGKLVTLPKEKCKVEECSDYYVEAITDMLKELGTFEKEINEYNGNINNINKKLYETVVKSISETNVNNLNISKTNIYEEYMKELNDKFNDKYLKYYKDTQEIIPREGVDNSRITQFKRRMRTFSIKNNVENEMHYVLENILIVKNLTKGFKEFLITLLKLIINLIPTIFVIIEILFKLLKHQIGNLIKNLK